MTARLLRAEKVTLPLPGAYLPAADDPAWAEMLVRDEVDVRRVTRAHAAALMQLCDRQMAELPETSGTRPGTGVLELMEALFEPPLRAWAWIAERRGEPAGYAFATVGFSMIERAYYFNLETLFVPASARPSDIAARLFAEARRMASDLGCVDLRWQVPVGQSGALMAMPGQTGAATMIQYVFPTLRSDQDD
ncbi:GNAT family N-acetyltransferase [Pseudoxanthomonas sp. PXM02]|uniref:GNAT family N-acetyltransferase n=1 Tax=Pseudoxanthomonas sp. PXM02 TaxID=2769294 RepID=UPI001784B13F|nr:GNAT family N-acetyltransferase [Pseudoxanthomonas sp. PXM02]MBD9479932.1 GNAT family N-acetyltransferase [Pseudoxanthomonas sp. PXM02]